MSKPPKAQKKEVDAKGKANTSVKKTEDLKTLIQKKSLNISRFGIKKIIIVACFVLLSIGGYLSWPYWSFSIPPFFLNEQWGKKVTSLNPIPSTKNLANISKKKLAKKQRHLNKSIEHLMARMKAIETDIAEVKRLAQATTQPSEEFIGTLSFAGRLDTLEKNNANIKNILKGMKNIKEKNIGHASDQAEIKNKTQKNPKDVFTYKGVAKANNAASLVLVVEDLRQAIATNSPVKKPLEAIKLIAGDNPNINAAIKLLANNKTIGISTLSVLKQRFNKIAGKIVQASHITDETGWGAQIKNRLYSMAMWRKINVNENDASIDAIVASAVSALKASDLKSAVSKLEGLSINSKAAKVAELWLIDANNHIATAQAIKILHIYAISQLAKIKPRKAITK